MTRRLITYALVALALTAPATSCSKEDKPQNQPVADGIIRATARIAAVTDGGTVSKAAVMPGQALDGIMFYKVDGEADNFHLGQTTLGMIDPNGKVTFATPLMYEITDTKHSHIFAVYPQGYILPDEEYVSWLIDGKTDIMATPAYTSWDAGSYTEPSTTPMILEHKLSRFEVICHADEFSSTELINLRWGKITAIELMNTGLNYTQSLVNRPNGIRSSGELKLVQGDYATDFAPIDIPASTNTTITAAAMVKPLFGSTQQFRITTTKTAPMLIDVKMSDAGLDEGKIYTVKFKFKADLTIEVSSPNISYWVTGYEPDPTDPNIEI